MGVSTEESQDIYRRLLANEPDALAGVFGLPRAIADRYALSLLRHRSRPSVAEWLRA